MADYLAITLKKNGEKVKSNNEIYLKFLLRRIISKFW